MKHFILTILVSFIINFLYAQKNCDIENTAFAPGEEITYEISYNWLIPWTKVGMARLSTSATTINNKPLLHVIGTGVSYSSWDWFMKVRDAYQTWMDPETLLPYYFKRDVHEGNFMIDITYRFNRDEQVVYSEYESTKHKFRRDTIGFPGCTFDVISILSYARNIDYSKYEVNDTIPVTILLDRKITKVYYRYLGKEKIKVKNIGKVDAIKFSIYLVEGTLFDGGEDMLLWCSDDENKVPLLIKTPILVGSIKAKIIGAKGIRNDSPIDFEGIND